MDSLKCQLYQRFRTTEITISSYILGKGVIKMTNYKEQHSFSYKFENTEYAKANKIAEVASIAIHGYFIGIGDSPVTETTISGDGTITVDYQGRIALGSALERICLGFADYFEQTTEEA